MRGLGFLRILLGTFVARCVSQALNYALNHRLVFVVDPEDESPRRCAGR